MPWIAWHEQPKEKTNPLKCLKNALIENLEKMPCEPNDILSELDHLNRYLEQ